MLTRNEAMTALNFYNCADSSIVAANEDIFNGDPATDVVSMSKAREIGFLITKNAGAVGTAKITIESCDDVTPSTATAIAGWYYRTCTTGNAWSAWTQVTVAATGFTTTAGANQMYQIHVFGELLEDGDAYVRMKCTEVVDAECDGAIICFGANLVLESSIPESLIT